MKPTLLFQSINFQNIADAITLPLELTQNYWLAVLGGVVIALLFQLILTVFSVALGITAVGDLKKSYAQRHTSKIKKEKQKNDAEFDQDYDENNGSTAVAISTGFGIWSLLTTSISLFGATAIAIHLTVFTSGGMAIAYALVVWAIFFLILFYLEVAVMSSVLGGIFHVVSNGLSASAATLKNVFTPSETTKTKEIIESGIEKFQNELFSHMDSSKVSKTIENFFSTVKKEVPSYSKLKKDLEDIAKSSRNKNSGAKMMAIKDVMNKAISSASEGDENSQNKSKKLKEMLEDMEHSFSNADTTEEGVKNAVAQLTDMDKKEIDEAVNSFLSSFSNSGSQDFSSESITARIKQYFDKGDSFLQKMSANKDAFSKQAIVDAVSKNTSFSRSEIEQYSTKIEETVRSAFNTLSFQDDPNMLQRLDHAIRDYLASSDEQHTINWDHLKQDFSTLFTDPKDGFSSFKNRLQNFDTETFENLASNNKYIAKEDVHKVVQAMKDARHELENKIQHIETRVREEYKMVERKAVIQAEHARETAASAAWWLTLTMVLAAAAAMGGTLLIF